MIGREGSRERLGAPTWRSQLHGLASSVVQEPLKLSSRTLLTPPPLASILVALGNCARKKPRVCVFQLDCRVSAKSTSDYRTGSAASRPPSHIIPSDYIYYPYI